MASKTVLSAAKLKAIVPFRPKVALDCEMVGDISDNSMLARCTVLNYSGQVLLDTFVEPSRPVYNYRTSWSGITFDLLARHPTLPYKNVHGHNLMTFSSCQSKVQSLLTGAIVIGHALYNDFQALDIKMPHPELVRDTSTFKDLQTADGKSQKLKYLAQTYLGRAIQSNGHSSYDDSLAALDIYKLFSKKWS